MAITNTTPHIPGIAPSKIESVVNNNSEPKPDAQEFEAIQVQKTRDHPMEQIFEPIKSEPVKKENVLKNFIGQELITFTTCSSALINMISAPIRLFDDNNLLKKIINQVSMFFTKLHLGAYSVAGLISSIEQKNPLLVFSFFTEGVAAFLGLRSIYLFRGIATGIDGAAAGIKDKHKRSHFLSYAEGWQHSTQAIKNTFKEFLHKFFQDPMHIFKLNGNDIAIFASLLAACGGVIGMTIHEKIGAAMRDVCGAVGDYGIFKLDNPIAKKSGFFYWGGSVLDLSARIFNKGMASFIGVKNVNAFEKLRDAFHEAAIAFDRAGQFFFLRYNQQSDEHLKNRTRDDKHGYLDSIRSTKIKAPEASLTAELAKERSYTRSA